MRNNTWLRACSSGVERERALSFHDIEGSRGTALFCRFTAASSARCGASVAGDSACALASAMALQARTRDKALCCGVAVADDHGLVPKEGAEDPHRDGQNGAGEEEHAEYPEPAERLRARSDGLVEAGPRAPLHEDASGQWQEDDEYGEGDEERYDDFRCGIEVAVERRGEAAQVLTRSVVDEGGEDEPTDRRGEDGHGCGGCGRDAPLGRWCLRSEVSVGHDPGSEGDAQGHDRAQQDGFVPWRKRLTDGGQRAKIGRVFARLLGGHRGCDVVRISGSLVRAHSKAVRRVGAMKKGQAMGDEDREVVIALDGHRAGKSMREIAENLYGAAHVAENWDVQSWMRWRMRRLLQMTRTHGDGTSAPIAGGQWVGQ